MPCDTILPPTGIYPKKPRTDPAKPMTTIDRLLSDLASNYAQHGFTFERKNRHITTTLPYFKEADNNRAIMWRM